MKNCSSATVNSLQFLRLRRLFSVRWWRFGRMQTRSCLQPLQQPAPRHPQIAQRKQRVQLRRVLGQSPVAHFYVPELPLDDPKRVFHLGPDSSLDVFKLLEHGAHGAVFVQRAAFAGAHGHHMPVDFDALDFFAFGHALVASVGEHIRFFAADQRTGLGHVVDVGGCADHGVNQSRVGVHSDVNTKGLPASR